MRKSTINRIRRLVAIILVVLMSIDGFAAVVSDNDGAAFITKAEFDSMKNNFQTSINEFNSGIDDKIQVAITNYLSSTKAAKRALRQKDCDATNWTFYNRSNYPKYTEGYPYIDGNCVVGHTNMQGWQTNNRVAWAAQVFPGVARFKENGGFKKHYFDKYVKKNNVIGGNRAYGAYAGYYEKEGEWIHLGGWTGSLSSGTWAHTNERSEYFIGTLTFEYASTPKIIYSSHGISCVHAEGHTGSTSIPIVVQAAERLPGEKVYGTSVGIYQDIADDRWYEVDKNNVIGITATSATTPIMDKTTVRNYGTWWKTVTASASVTYACSELRWTPDSSYTYGGYWTDYADYSYFYQTIKELAYHAEPIWNTDARMNNEISYVKLANDKNEMQFKYLWSPDTNTAAIKLHNMLSDSTVKNSVKTDIRNVLIYDADNTPHLSMIAGYPFLTVKKGDKVSWDFKANGTYPSCLIIGKYGPFTTATSDPNGQMNVEFSNTTNTNKYVFNVDCSKTNTLKFTASEDGIVFLKWYATGSTPPTFDVSNNPLVEWEG